MSRNDRNEKYISSREYRCIIKEDHHVYIKSRCELFMNDVPV